MAWRRREPDPARPCMTTGEAARILKCRPVTMRRRIERGDIQGGQKPNGKWYVYADRAPFARPHPAAVTQAPSAAYSSEQERLARENAELRAQVAELRLATAETRARQAEAQNAQIVAALHVMNEVLGEFHKGAELAQQSNTHFQAGSATMSRVMSALLDTVAMTNLPENAEGI
jgi:hypothetical protein